MLSGKQLKLAKYLKEEFNFLLFLKVWGESVCDGKAARACKDPGTLFHL